MKRRQILKVIAQSSLLSYLGLPRALFAQITGAASPTKSKASESMITASPNVGVIESTADSVTIPVFRAKDLLNLSLRFDNFKLRKSPAPFTLVKIDPTKPAYLIVGFPPQHIGEYAFMENDNDDFAGANGLAGTRGVPPVPAFMSLPSRLVFSIPPNITQIPFTLIELLSWEKYFLKVAPVALPPPYFNVSGDSPLPPVPRLIPLRKSQGQFGLPTYPRYYTPPTASAGDPNKPSLAEDSWSKSAGAEVWRIKSDAKISVGRLKLADTGFLPSVEKASGAFGPLMPQISEPNDKTTAIEMYRRFVISPNVTAAWAHKKSDATNTAAKAPAVLYSNPSITQSSVIPIQAFKPIELWHTRLGTRKQLKDGSYVVDESDPRFRTIRAIWTSHFNPGNPKAQTDTGDQYCIEKDVFGEPVLKDRTCSVIEDDQNQIVHLTSDYSLSFTRPVNANRLMLTSLGAWLDLEGQWKPALPYSKASWKHRATMGRDQYVKLVDLGYLIPFGNRCVEITIAERKVHSSGYAYLRYYKYLVVTEPVRVFPKPADAAPNIFPGRSIPFSAIEIKSLVTPKLSNSDQFPKYFVKVNGQVFRFHVIARDWEGRETEFLMPMMWFSQSDYVTENENHKPEVILAQLTQAMQNKMATTSSRVISGEDIAQADAGEAAKFYRSIYLYNASSLNGNNNTVEFYNQQIAYAGNNAAYHTQSITFEAWFHDQLPFFIPIMKSAKLSLTAAEQMSGASALPATIQFYPRFTIYGLNANNNPGMLFASAYDKDGSPRAALNYQANLSGGVATPNILVGGLSSSYGIIGGDADEFNQWKTPESQPSATDPFFTKYFNGAKLLGGLSLGELIDPRFRDDDAIPRIDSKTFETDGIPTSVQTTLHWKPQVQPNWLLFSALGPLTDTLTLDAVITTDLVNNQTEYSVHGILRNFILSLAVPDFSVLKLNFKHFEFNARNNQKLDVNVRLNSIEFDGPLKFIDNLRELIDPAGFSDPPNLEVDAQGARLFYSLPFPSVQVGVFSLQHLLLSAAMNLPFDGSAARISFAFCERNNPLLVTVGVFGGTGYFGIRAGIDGIELLEGALEFGGAKEIDLGVASGGVAVMAGIFFAIETYIDSNDGKEKEACTLTGSLRAGGALEVLGLICVSIEFYLALTYQSNNNKVSGQATVSVKVEVCFFSKTVHVSLERRFAGSGADPTFQELMAGDDKLIADNKAWERQYANYWEAYCDGFAPVEANQTPAAPNQRRQRLSKTYDYLYNAW